MIDILFTNSLPVRTRMHNLLAYKLGWKVNEINDHLHLVNELYIDSLDLMEIEIGISETFNVEISEKELLSAETVGDLCLIVERQLSSDNRLSLHTH